MNARDQLIRQVANLVESDWKGKVGFYLGRPVILVEDDEGGWVRAYDPEENKPLRFWGEQIKTLPFGRRVQRVPS